MLLSNTSRPRLGGIIADRGVKRCVVEVESPYSADLLVATMVFSLE